MGVAGRLRLTPRGPGMLRILGEKADQNVGTSIALDGVGFGRLRRVGQRDSAMPPEAFALRHRMS